MAKAVIDEKLYEAGGVVDKRMANAPLVITEKPHPVRAADDTPCHDCGRLIARGEGHIVSAIESTKGVHGKTQRYPIHQACYDVVGRVVSILGKMNTHSMDGRPPLTELWKANAEAIRAADGDLAAMLERAFGVPK